MSPPRLTHKYPIQKKTLPLTRDGVWHNARGPDSVAEDATQKWIKNGSHQSANASEAALLARISVRKGWLCFDGVGFVSPPPLIF
mmetsp:Transcript_85468/g.170626  ORF Transcript_85468/g.170626 Transcript_85468/m.170626 type:complete len:85 (-) Transcript_85468:1064-1318(-)